MSEPLTAQQFGVLQRLSDRLIPFEIETALLRATDGRARVLRDLRRTDAQAAYAALFSAAKAAASETPL